MAQAEGLLDTLADLRVERPLTSPSLRCRQTLLPLAAALDLDLSSVDDLGTDGDVDRLVDLLAAGDKGSTWVLDGAADGRSDARYLPPPAPRTKHRGGGRAWGIRTRGRSRPSAACLVACCQAPSRRRRLA